MHEKHHEPDQDNDQFYTETGNNLDFIESPIIRKAIQAYISEHKKKRETLIKPQIWFAEDGIIVNQIQEIMPMISPDRLGLPLTSLETAFGNEINWSNDSCFIPNRIVDKIKSIVEGFDSYEARGKHVEGPVFLWGKTINIGSQTLFYIYDVSTVENTGNQTSTDLTDPDVINGLIEEERKRLSGNDPTELLGIMHVHLRGFAKPLHGSFSGDADFWAAYDLSFQGEVGQSPTQKKLSGVFTLEQDENLIAGFYAFNPTEGRTSIQIGNWVQRFRGQMEKIMLWFKGNEDTHDVEAVAAPQYYVKARGGGPRRIKQQEESATIQSKATSYVTDAEERAQQRRIEAAKRARKKSRWS